jgi:ferredoxin
VKQHLPSGKTVEVSRDKTLLTAALDAGLDFPHNCKFGSAVNVSVSWLKVK